MHTNKKLINYKRHLKDRCLRLIEKSNDYRFIDEVKSDIAAYKAMKLLKKIDQVRYLDREVTLY
jgi:hypothetical protein